MKKLEKGMYLAVKKEFTMYDTNTFAPIDVKVGTFAEVEYAGVGMSYTESVPLVSIIVVKINNIPIIWQGEHINKFNEIFEVA